MVEYEQIILHNKFENYLPQRKANLLKSMARFCIVRIYNFHRSLHHDKKLGGNGKNIAKVQEPRNGLYYSDKNELSSKF